MPPDPADPSRPALLLHGDYEYLSEGYYACIEAEENGLDAIPTCADALDAYTVPLALERARLAGLATPTWTFTNGHFQTPAVLYGVNPFARSYVVVHDADERQGASDKISRQGKYVMCCQTLPPGAKLPEFEAIFGKSPDERWSTWAQAIFRVFALPLCKVRIIECEDGSTFLSAIERLPQSRLSKAGRALLATAVSEFALSNLKTSIDKGEELHG
jgi:hypothetical protein